MKQTRITKLICSGVIPRDEESLPTQNKYTLTYSRNNLTASIIIGSGHYVEQTHIGGYELLKSLLYQKGCFAKASTLHAVWQYHRT